LTISVMVLDWLTPEAVVAVTVTVLVLLVGCVGVPADPPPQPIKPNPALVRMTANRTTLQRFMNAPLRFRERRSKQGSRANSGAPFISVWFAAVRTAVVILRATVEVPLDCSEGVPKVQVDPVGKPEQEKVSVWLKPFAGVTVKVVLALCPPATVNVEDEAESAKLGVETAVTTTETAADVCEPAKVPSPP